jgi:AcrR family transcriptional regulator
MGTGRRDSIAQAALELFNRRGFDATSVQDICEASGASVGSIYHWFGNKNGIASALLVEALQSNLAATELSLQSVRTPKQAVAAVIRSVLTWATDHPGPATFVYAATVGPASEKHAADLAEVSHGWDALWKHHFDRWWESGALRRLPHDAFVSILLGPTHDYLRRWLNHQVSDPPAHHRDLLADAAWRSLKGSTR